MILIEGYRLGFIEFGDLQGKNDSKKLTIFPVDLDPISNVCLFDTPFICWHNFSSKWKLRHS
jgi:hypothetical protein